MTQIERIEQMENILDRLQEAVAQANDAISHLRELGPLALQLDDYYGSPEWFDDLQADEKGLLPKGLKRGVLSEDGIYDVLNEYKSFRTCFDL
ncbi:MAG: DUF4298 domain-containing protein [Bacteroidaceae bacterium]|nr:DUF4298 domain-containing protein [Bacteroidaceae bacterium]